MMKLVDSFSIGFNDAPRKTSHCRKFVPIGTATFNASLAEQRAEQMKQRLVERKQMEAQRDRALEYIGEN